MGQTTIPYGSPSCPSPVRRPLCCRCSADHLNRLTGKLPLQSDAEGSLRFQSGNELPVVRWLDLSVGRRRSDFDLINLVGGKPIMGERYAEGARARTWTFAGQPHQSDPQADFRRRQDDAAAHPRTNCAAWPAWATTADPSRKTS